VSKCLPQWADYVQNRSAGRSVDPFLMENEVLSVLKNSSPDEMGIEFITAVSVNIVSSAVWCLVILYTAANVMEEHAASIHPKTETAYCSSILKSVVQTTGRYS